MPADTTRIFVALRPHEPLDALIRGYKRRLLAAAGPQMYATDPPHTTLLVANFPRERAAELLRAARDLAAATPAPEATIAGWHVFESDPLTGLHTLVCRYCNETCQRLRIVQRDVLAAVAPLRDVAATQAAIAPRLPLLSAEEQRCAAQFGFPYVGDGWIPHLTIASVRPSQWPHVEQVFNLSQKRSGQVENLSHVRDLCTAFDVFELQGLEPRLVESFPLAPRPVGKVA